MSSFVDDAIPKLAIGLIGEAQQAMDEPVRRRWSPGKLVAARGREWIVTHVDPARGLLELRPLAAVG
ncbi:MAG: hypothetical protein N2038_15665, partial [Geminicoccaceae bacterium]|nr:hypothetical protein [Geminicoccaceae bacterium]